MERRLQEGHQNKKQDKKQTEKRNKRTNKEQRKKDLETAVKKVALTSRIIVVLVMLSSSFVTFPRYNPISQDDRGKQLVPPAGNLGRNRNGVCQVEISSAKYLFINPID